MSPNPKQSGLFPDMESMDTSQINQSLERIFSQEQHRIVFWYDPEEEFIDVVSHLDLDEVKIIRANKESSLELKVRLELDDTESRYLLYYPCPEPPMEQDWLLDVKLYSRTFHADRATILLNELGLETQSMRNHLAERKKFFDSKERLKKLKRLVSSEDNEDDLDVKMVAVLVRAEQPTAFDILMKLLGSMCDDDHCNPTEPPQHWNDIVKFGLELFFWKLVAKNFGYSSQKPTLQDLLIRLLVSDLAKHLKGELPASLQHLQFAESSLFTNVAVFASQWRGNLSEHKNYRLLSGRVAKDLKLAELLSGYDEEALLDVMTFEAAERQVIRSIRDKIAVQELDSSEDLKSVIKRRRDGHWCNISIATGGPSIYETIYRALESAIDLLLLREEYKDGFSYPNASTMFAAYNSQIFKFDQHYRILNESADQVELEGWDILRSLEKVIEGCYSGWYLDQIAVAWGSFVENGLLESWKLEGVSAQQDFFVEHVRPVLGVSPKSRVFVVISDALRFEAADELTSEINGKNRFRAELKSQLGVLPSYTALGMAALLPHREMKFGEGKSLDIQVDGLSTGSIESRSKVLGADHKYPGVAIKASDLWEKERDQAREWLKDYRVIYIYHNKIDSVGDAAATENNTFQAVRTTIDELSKLISHIINNLNGTNVIVTADHGFLFQNTPPGDLAKSTIDIKPPETLKAKKRYLLGKNMGESSKVWHGRTSITAETVDDMEFWIPKGNNLFHFAGGAKFIHGGALLQEISVPVMLVRQMKGKAAQDAVVKQVGISLLGSSNKIVNNISRFTFIQTEAVTDKHQPVSLSISLRDGENMISNEEVVTFDSKSDSMEDRKRTITLILKEGEYDKGKHYYLVMRHQESQIEYDRIAFTIDLAFAKDF